jgi:hypothetical protein
LSRADERNGLKSIVEEATLRPPTESCLDLQLQRHI